MFTATVLSFLETSKNESETKSTLSSLPINRRFREIDNKNFSGHWILLRISASLCSLENEAIKHFLNGF